jgi:hypothetical protein
VGNAILPSSLRGIQINGVVWKTIDIDDRWTSSSIVMVYQKEALEEPVQASFIKYVRQSSSRCGLQSLSDGNLAEASSLYHELS